MNDLTILFLIGSLELGGAERQMATLIRYLAVGGLNCHLFVLESPAPIFNDLEKAAIKIHEGGYCREKDPVRKALLLLRAQFKMLNVLKDLADLAEIIYLSVIDNLYRLIPA